MPSRLRFIILLIGALLVVATFTYDRWRMPPEGDIQQDALAELSPDLRGDFDDLPRSVQTSYQLMSEENPSMAVNLVEARLQPVEPATIDLPEVGNAQVVRTGDFRPLDLTEDEREADPERELPAYNNIFSAAGRVDVYRYPDNRYLFRLEDLSVVNGPDLWLVLSTSPEPFRREEFGRDFIEIAPLASNSGNMNFELRDLDLTQYQSLVIYDRRYQMIYAVAPLT